MNKRTWELWGIPIIIGLVLLILGVYLNALATGVQLRPPFTGGWLKSLLTASVQLPLWTILLIAVVVVGIWIFLRRRNKKTVTSSANADSATELEPAQKLSFVAPSVESPRPAGATNGPPNQAIEDDLVIPSPEDFSVRIKKAANSLELSIENHRLTSIHQIRLIISTVCSFDARHNAFRESAINAVTVNLPNLIRPSGAGNPTRLVWAEPGARNMFVGANNLRFQLPWPDLDNSEIERWRLSLRVLAFTWPPSAANESTPLKELFTDIVVLRDRSRNELSIEKPIATTPPPADPAFPANGADGVHRTTVRYILCGEERLLAYESARDGLPGTRFEVVRHRSNQTPQSLIAPDRETANAKWNEWYRELKLRGFGGCSGNGLDGEPPF